MWTPNVGKTERVNIEDREKVGWKQRLGSTEIECWPEEWSKIWRS